MGPTHEDDVFMKRALALAVRGRGYVEPNPMVGCVIVRQGRIIAEGFHRRYGDAHAEVDALRRAGSDVRGSDVYVTLEPCCHHGKTPPCTEAIIAAGVRRVVAAMRDPFPKVAGRGLRRLRAAGIEAEAGLCEAEARELNAPYLKRQRTGRPWVILKWAQSLDGKIATRTGDSRWISGEASRRRAHQLRGRVDGVLVGVGTVVADDPALTCRHGRPRRIATRIVLDPSLRTPLKAALVRSAAETPVLIVTDRRNLTARQAASYQRCGVELVGLRKQRDRMDLGALLDELGRRGMTNLLVEGGGRTLGAFMDAGLADEAVIFVAHRLIGGADAPSPLAGKGPAIMADLPAVADVTRTRAGEDDVYRVRLAGPHRATARS